MTDQLGEQVKTSESTEIKPSDTPVTPPPPARDAHGRLLPGHTANLSGRPKGTSITALLRERLNQIPDGFKQTYKEMFVENLLKKAALQGEFQEAKLIMNYADGMPKQFIEHSGEVATYTKTLKEVLTDTDNAFAESTADSEADEPRSQDSQQEPGSSTPNAQPVAGEVQQTSPTA